MPTLLIEEMDTLTLYLAPRFQPHRGVAVRLQYTLRANLSLWAPIPLISAKEFWSLQSMLTVRSPK